MPDSTPSGAVDRLERQVRQVRRRRNLHELQRALYLMAATAAGSAAVLVILALGASARFFAVAVWSVAGAVLVTATLLALETRRRWLGAARAAAWIDARARLHGRLATLMETRACGVRPADAFFLPLLAQQNVQRLTVWQPALLVPRRVPRGALAVALAATGLLLLALALAPGLRPLAPEIIYSDRPIDGLETSDAGAGLPDRLVVAPRPRARAGGDLSATRAGDTDAADEQSALARLGSALQERIRRELWGEAWDRMREAMARAESATETEGGIELDGGEDSAPGEDWEPAGLPPEQLATRLGRRGIEGAAGFEPGDDRAAGDSAHPGGTESGDGGGARAAGAGNDTDRNLFGRPSVLGNGAASMFELALAAPVRTRRGAYHRPSGEAPPPAPDARPALGARQREHAAVSKMTVPPAYETIVREVFAHRAAEDEMTRLRRSQ